MRVALILGGALCVHADAEAARQIFEPDIVVAINDIGIEWSHVDHWVTLHPKASGRQWRQQQWPGIQHAMELRIAAKRNKPQTWAHKPHPGIDQSEPDWGGSSSLLAGKICLRRLGIDRVVLAGVPMDNQPHYSGGGPWAHASTFQRAWKRHLPEIAAGVRSMSGWTQNLLGAPTEEWLLSRDQVQEPVRRDESMSAYSIPMVAIVNPLTGEKKVIQQVNFREGLHQLWDAPDPIPESTSQVTVSAKTVVKTDDQPSDLKKFMRV